MALLHRYRPLAQNALPAVAFVNDMFLPAVAAPSECRIDYAVGFLEAVGNRPWIHGYPFTTEALSVVGQGLQRGMTYALAELIDSAASLTCDRWLLRLFSGTQERESKQEETGTNSHGMRPRQRSAESIRQKHGEPYKAPSPRIADAHARCCATCTTHRSCRPGALWALRMDLQRGQGLVGLVQFQFEAPGLVGDKAERGRFSGL